MIDKGSRYQLKIDYYGSIPQIFIKQNIQGIQMREPNQSMCTGCSRVFPALFLMLLAAYTGEPYDNIEILVGKTMRPGGRAGTTFFMGDCNYVANHKYQDVSQGVRLKGCPPTIDEIIRVFNKHRISLKEESNTRFFMHKGKVYDKLGYPYEDYYFSSRSSP